MSRICMSWESWEMGDGSVGLAVVVPKMLNAIDVLVVTTILSTGRAVNGSLGCRGCGWRRGKRRSQSLLSESCPLKSFSRGCFFRTCRRHHLRPHRHCRHLHRHHHHPLPLRRPLRRPRHRRPHHRPLTAPLAATALPTAVPAAAVAAAVTTATIPASFSSA